MFVFTVVSLLASGWSFESRTFRDMPIVTGWFIQGGLFAFPDGLLPVNFGVPFEFSSSLPFSITLVNLSEKVNEVVASLCLSCSVHACAKAPKYVM